MRVTVINPDKAIGVGGEFFLNLPFTLDPSIHAIQWYDTWGEVEYVVRLVDQKPFKPVNETITSFEPFSYLLDVWQVAKDEAVAQEAARLAALAAFEQEQAAASQQTSETQP
jgi:hypothetical protein